MRKNTKPTTSIHANATITKIQVISKHNATRSETKYIPCVYQFASKLGSADQNRIFFPQQTSPAKSFSLKKEKTRKIAACLDKVESRDTIRNTDTVENVQLFRYTDLIVSACHIKNHIVHSTNTTASERSICI